jgi:hypothetical protein
MAAEFRFIVRREYIPHRLPFRISPALTQKSTCKFRPLKVATLAVDSWELPNKVVSHAGLL